MKRTLKHRAFTLVELLAVVVIIIVLIGLAVPAFAALIASSEKALAQNKLAVALTSAQSEAYASGGDRDAAAVFVFNPEGRLTVLTCVSAGEIVDERSGNHSTSPGEFPTREVFAPVASSEPLQLPTNWTVRGFAPAGSIDEDWYQDARYTRDEGNWVFPETGYFDNRTSDDGRDRQTFAVRFDSSTGHVAIGEPQDFLVFDPRLTGLGRSTNPFNAYRADQVTNAERFVRRITLASNLSESDRRELLGDESGDTILARPVNYLALTDEKELAGAIGARVNPNSNSLYEDTTEPEFITGVTADTVNAWIEGRDPDSGDEVETSARVYRVGRYAGAVEEVERRSDEGSN